MFWAKNSPFPECTTDFGVMSPVIRSTNSRFRSLVGTRVVVVVDGVVVVVVVGGGAIVVVVDGWVVVVEDEVEATWIGSPGSADALAAGCPARGRDHRNQENPPRQPPHSHMVVAARDGYNNCLPDDPAAMS